MNWVRKTNRCLSSSLSMSVDYSLLGVRLLCFKTELWDATCRSLEYNYKITLSKDAKLELIYIKKDKIVFLFKTWHFCSWKNYRLLKKSSCFYKVIYVHFHADALFSQPDNITKKLKAWNFIRLTDKWLLNIVK